MKQKYIFIFAIAIVSGLILFSGCTNNIEGSFITKDKNKADTKIKDKTKFCKYGTPVGKCNFDQNSINFYKFCNEKKDFVDDCQQCGCFESIAECNQNTKKCEINYSKRCPPYEAGCEINKEIFSSCEETMKLKGDVKIGIIILSQFTEQQFPMSYLHLIKNQLNQEEIDFFNNVDYLKGNLDYYKLDYINDWLKEQTKRKIGNENFANLLFKFSTKEVCYLGYDDYHETNQSQVDPKVAPGKNNKLFDFMINNCMEGLGEDIDAFLVLGFVLDGAETLRSGVGLGGHRGGIKTVILINDEKIPLAFVDVTTQPPFCKKKDVPYYEKCQFPLGGSRSGTGCIELECFAESCCYNSVSSDCIGGCYPTGIRDINVFSAHELLHVFGVPDHQLTVEVEGYHSCADFDTDSIPLDLRNNQLPQCGDRTICSVCDHTGSLPLECAVITDKEARELGWNDNNGNGILEINE